MKWLKQLFCKHDYASYVKADKFKIISGERVYVVCSKCFKEKCSYFVPH